MKPSSKQRECKSAVLCTEFHIVLFGGEGGLCICAVVHVSIYGCHRSTYGCLLIHFSTLCCEIWSLAEAITHHFSEAGWPSIQMPCPPALGLQTCTAHQTFTWGQRIQALVLSLVQQALYLPNHLPSPVSIILKPSTFKTVYPWMPLNL